MISGSCSLSVPPPTTLFPLLAASWGDVLFVTDEQFVFRCGTNSPGLGPFLGMSGLPRPGRHFASSVVLGDVLASLGESAVS